MSDPIPFAIYRQHEETLDDAVRKINILVEKSAEHSNKAVDLRKKAGQEFWALRQRIEAGEAGEDNKDWWKWARGRFTRTRRDIEKLLEIGGASDPEAATDKERTSRAKGMAESRAKDAQPEDTSHVGRNQSEYDPVEDVLDRIERLSDADRARLFAKLEEHPQWRE